MFSKMKQDALQFSSIIFLDACKRDINKPGLPYQSVVVMNNNMQVLPVCEGLTIAERLDVYSFIINACKSMEPRFNLSDINIIMADQ